MLGSAEYRSILSVLEQTGRSVTLESFAETTLEAVQRELGYRTCILMIADMGTGGADVRNGAMRGGINKMEEYFERWSDREPFNTPVALSRLASHGVAHLGEFYDQLDAPEREFCWDFLAPSIRDQLSTHIDTGLATQGFLTLSVDELGSFDRRDLELMRALRPHLANQLRALLVAPGAAERSLAGDGDGLTPRQLEVASLAARGLRNAEIGTALAISEATVKKHLVQVYRRLGINTRAELAARAGALGIEDAAAGG